MRLENFNFYCSNNFLLLHLNSNGIEDDNIQSLGDGLCLVKHRKLFTLCKIQSQWQNSAWGAKYPILLECNWAELGGCGTTMYTFGYSMPGIPVLSSRGATAGGESQDVSDIRIVLRSPTMEAQFFSSSSYTLWALLATAWSFE